MTSWVEDHIRFLGHLSQVGDEAIEIKCLSHFVKIAMELKLNAEDLAELLVDEEKVVGNI